MMIRSVNEKSDEIPVARQMIIDRIPSLTTSQLLIRRICYIVSADVRM